MKLAIDAMGGDNAPEAIITGVEAARDQYSDVEFLVFGTEDKVRHLIQKWDRITFIPTTEEIEMAEEPVKAMRKKKDSSMVRAANAVKNGEADALFSAGNTGALLSSAIFIVGRIKGIERPALLATLPALKGKHDKWVFMDVGANAEAKPSHLYQYGILGSFYAQDVLGFDNPTVGLLNNGSEEDKGDEVHKTAHQLMAGTDAFNFIGNVEARYYLQGAADVVVADGFSGNAALKATEGTALTIINFLKQAIGESGPLAKVGALLLKPVFKKLAKTLDYNNAGGAVILGVNAPVVKAHGSAKATVVTNTIGQIRTMVASDLVPHIQTYVAENQDALNAAQVALQAQVNGTEK
jgi:glycerol-3-phosphate acyltransferase PlsX